MSRLRSWLAGTWRRFLALAISLVARVWIRTLRVRLHQRGESADGPLIHAFLHGQQLPLLRYPLRRPAAALVSHSRDGSLSALVLDRLGFRILRGSSTRGGAAALRSCLEWLGSAGNLVLAVDGPRGPAGMAKPGVIQLAEKAHVPILPVACAASAGRKLARSWDGFLLPAPFCRVPILAGPEFRPWEKNWTDERKLAYLDSLIAELADRADREAAGVLGNDDPGEHRWADRPA
jgi:lysophospholipid acyltransferase (LPLAT)-like uncharacterized protein